MSVLHSAISQDKALDEEACPEDDATVYKITIHLGDVTGLQPVYPVSEIQLTVQFGDETLFQSEKIVMSETLAIDEAITQTIDITDQEQINKYITTPLVFSLLEFPVPVVQENVIETGKSSGPQDQNADVCGRVLWRSEESILDLEEALFGKKAELPDKRKSTTKKASSKSKSKSSRSSTASKASRKSKKSRKSAAKSKDSGTKIKDGPQPSGPQVAGSAALDMVPMFLENLSIVETVVLKAPAGQALDDRMKSASNLPTLQVNIFLDREIPSGNMFYYTVESVYNLPKVMSSGMNYQMMVAVPSDAANSYRLVPFNTFEYAERPRVPFGFKKYYGSPQLSNFILKDDFDDVRCDLGVELSEALSSDFPRIEYNVVKGEFASDEEIDNFKTKIMMYRCIGIEIYMSNPSAMAPAGTKSKTGDVGDAGRKSTKSGSKKSKKSKKGSKAESKKGKDKEHKDASSPSNEEYLHMMAFIDICRLLYPGEQKVRVASELRTFNLEEFSKRCGVKDSFFRPKPPPPEPPEPKIQKPEKKDKSEKKGSKKGSKKDSKKGSKKGSKSSKASKTSKVKKGKKGHGDLASKLPKAPPPPPPSEPVFNEEGHPTFMIVEFEFRYPLTIKKEVEELHEELDEIVQSFPATPTDPRHFKSTYVTADLFQNSVKSLFQQLKNDYLQYLERGGQKDNLLDFVEYLTSCEQYQAYLNTLTKSAADYCNVAQRYDPEWSDDEYRAFIGQAYVDLVGLLNVSITQIGIAGDDAPKRPRKDIVGLLFYAKEAAEIDALGLAQHYYLQRIKENDANADYWLDYAIYKLQIGETDAAQECAIEALKYGPSNRDCLVFFALLIARVGKFAEAETCILNITVNHPRWTEGWMALYCVYQRSRNHEGMEVSLEMAERHSKEKQDHRFEDLNWTAQKLPDRHTFRSIRYFINLRLLEEAELILADEILKRRSDVTEYILAVLSMIKGHAEHAYDHIEAALQIGRCSYEKNLVRGHIFMAMGKLDCALTEYEKILKTTDDVPYDGSIHMLYVRAGLCYSALGMSQLARKVLLKASEKQGTPYSWLATGVLYYHQHDYISAEECLNISNTLDNIMPETWAYLTLVNIKMGRPNEATSCYHQAIDHKLQNEALIRTIDAELAQWEAEFYNSTTPPE